MHPDPRPARVEGANDASTSRFDPVTGKRLIIYVVYDPRGEIDDYIPHALAALRPFATEIMAVVNGALAPLGRERLAPHVDEILVRGNLGYDIGADKDALAALGDRVQQFDEVILMNDTWYGPVHPFEPVFARMDAQELDFWGLTDHNAEIPDPFTGSGEQPRHLQSYWIAVRKRMLRSEAWSKYWREMPYFEGYWDAVRGHEIIFTKYFEDQGFVSGVAFGHERYPSKNASIYTPELLILDGCPIVKRRPFFHDPPFLARHAVIGRWVLRELSRTGFPMKLVWQNLARTVSPRVLAADCAMLEVLHDVVDTHGAPYMPRLLVVAHVREAQAGNRLLHGLAVLPRHDLIVTVDNCGLAEQVRAEHGRRALDVRVFPDGGEGDIAFLIAAGPEITSDSYDLVVKLHDEHPAHGPSNVNRYRFRQSHDSLVGTASIAQNALRLFAREPGLGAVFSPAPHFGVPPAERRWGSDLGIVVDVRESLGLRVPLDSPAPLEPGSGMWIARPKVLRLLAKYDWARIADRQAGEVDGRVSRAVRRTLPYAAGELGLHTRMVLSAQHVSISHTAVEYKLDLLASTSYGHLTDQLTFLDRAGWHGEKDALSLGRLYLRYNHPEFARVVIDRARATRAASSRVKAAISRRMRRST